MILEKDLIALPELTDKTLDWMIAEARRRGAAVTGSIAVEEPSPVGGGPSRLYNRMYFVRPDGSVEFYDKRHLFFLTGESARYTAGDQRVIVEWRGWRILLQVCYDLRFPVFSRNGGGSGKADYDVIVYSADWPPARIDAWNILLRARAVENVCYVVGVNRDRTQLIDYKGVEQEITAELDLEALREFRRKFPVLDDADGYQLKL